tara:strand:- start:39285 stop:42833 length:3549 start_codon:yes stop_codon:yes gene_type:complete
MAFPGVTATETDLSGITSAGITGIPVGVIGTAPTGPAFVPTSVGSLDDWRTIFSGGYELIDGTQFGPMAAAQWLGGPASNKAVTYIRVLGVGDGKKRGTTGTVTSAGMVVGDKLVQSNGLVGANPYANAGTTGNPGTKGRTYFLATFMSESNGCTIFSEAGIQGSASSSGATATIQSVSATPAQYDTGTLTITDARGTTKTYIFDDDSDGATGTVDGSSNVRIQLNGLSTCNTIAAQIKAAIEHANGHNGTITIAVSTADAANDTLTLTQATGPHHGNNPVTRATVTNDAIYTISDFTGGKPSGDHAVPILRGVIMAPSGVTLSLSGNYSANSNLPKNSTDVAAVIPGKGGLTGSVKIADSSFVMLLNGFKPPSSDVKNVITASFSNATGGTFFPKALNTDPSLIEHHGHYLYTWYDIPDSHAAITGSGLLSPGATDGGGTFQDAVILTTGSLDRTGTPSTGAPIQPNYENFRDRFRTPFSPHVISQNFGGAPYDLFRVHTFADGAAPTQLYKVTISSLAPSTDENANPYGTFDLTLRSFNEDDTSTGVSGIKTWAGLTLDPTSDKYIAKQIGDQYTYFDFDKNEDSQKLVVDGDYPLQNAWIRVEMSDAIDSGNVPKTALPMGFRGPHHLITSGSGPLASLPKPEATAYGHGTALSGTIDVIKHIVEPPIPMREHVCTQDYGVADTASSNFTWGIQFELKNSVNKPNTTSDILADDDSVIGSGIENFTKYFPSFWEGGSYSVSVGNNSGKSMVGGTVLDSDVFNNNKFTLENLHIRTGSTGLADNSAWHSASYKRNGKMPGEDLGTGGAWLTDGNESYKKRRFKVADLRGETGNQNYAQFTFFLQGGWDGTNIFDTEKSKLSGVAAYREMNDVTNQLGVKGPTVATYRKAIDVMGNTSDVDIQLLAVPGQFDPGVSDYAIDMVESRFDALYLMDITEKTTFDDVVTGSIAEGSGVERSPDKTLSNFKNRSINSSFVASYYPQVLMSPPDSTTQQWQPASVAAMGAYALNDYLGNPWSAPAGYTRGLVNGTEVRKRVTNTDVQSDMYDAGINLILQRDGQALAIWGQKTGKTGTSSLNRVNVRRLLISVRRSVKAVARTLLFEPNRASTLAKFESLVNPILQTVQEKSGVNRFKVVIDTTTTTQADIENNTIRGKIFLEPTRTAEYISLDFTVMNSDQFDSL